MSEEDAFLSAIEANLTDTLVRGVYADWLDEHGRGDEAAAWRATADRVPWQTVVLKGQERWSWREHPEGEYRPLMPPPACFLSRKLFQALPSGSMVGFVYRDYPTARAALLDLIAAWGAVEREKEKKAEVCAECVGTGGRPNHCWAIVDDPSCPACRGKAVAANG